MSAGQTFVEGHYSWPFDGNLRPSNTAVMFIDLQLAHCGRSDSRRRDDIRAAVAHSKQVLDLSRERGFHVLFTRRGYRRDLSDLPQSERWRAERRDGVSHILRRGEPEWEIVPELTPKEAEPVVDKPSMSAFYATDLEQVLHRNGIRNLIIAGVFTDGSIQATLRDANDRGFECLLLEDCCAAADPENHAGTVKMLKLLCGLYGSVSSSQQLLKALA